MFESQESLLKACEDNKSGEFWKSIGKIGLGSERTKHISMETVQEDGSLKNAINKVLFKWKHAFQTLLNCETDTHFDENNDTVNILEHHNTEQLNQGISLHDVR